MRFKIFQIKYKEGNYLKNVKNSDIKNFFNSLNSLPLMYDKNDLKYAIINLHNEEEYILGTFTQEYNVKLTKFMDDKTKNEIRINENVVNDKTYFFIDAGELKLYIQNRRFPTDSGLKQKNMIEKFTKIFENIFTFNFEEIVLFPIKIEYKFEDFDYYFINYNVKYLEVKNIRGIELPKDAKLHNPRIGLDEALIESWNTYSKDTLDSFELKSSNENALNKNPLAKIGMNLAKKGNDNGIEVIKIMKIKDEGEEEVLKPKGNEYKVINIPNSIKNDPYNFYDKILKVVKKDYKGRY